MVLDEHLSAHAHLWEAARVVLDKIPMAKPAQAILSKTSLWLFGAICLLQALTGCAGPEKAGAAVGKAWDFYNENYERSLAISTTTDGKPMATFTITQRQPVKPVATAAPSDFTQEQVAELMPTLPSTRSRTAKPSSPPGNETGAGHIGGGMRGAIPARALVEIERITGQPIHQTL